MEGLKELLAKHKESELTEAQFEEELNKILPKEWKPAKAYNELSEKYKTLEKQNVEYAKTLEQAGKDKTSLEDLAKRFESLKAEHKAELEKKEAEFAQYRKDSYIDNAIARAGAKTAKAVKALIDTSKVVSDNNGSYLGLDEQIKAIKENSETSYLFSDVKEGGKPSFGGGGSTSQSAPGDEVSAIRAAFGLN